MLKKLNVLLMTLILVLGLTTLVAAESQYYVKADMVRGGKNATGPVCVLCNSYKLGEQVVFRAEVYDAQTNERITAEEAEELDLKVTAVVEDVDEFELSLGNHPQEEPQIKFWAGPWNIPSIFETGWYKWTIKVEDGEGNTHIHEPLGARRPEMPGSWIYIEQRD